MTRNNCYRSGFMVFFILALAFCALDAPAFTVESSGAGCAVDLDLNTTDYDPAFTEKDIESAKKVQPGETFLVGIVAHNVENLDTYQVEVHYDESVLSFHGAAEANPMAGISNLLVKNGGQTLGFQATPISEGVVTIANALIGKSEEQAPEGSGIIAILSFRAHASVETAITLDNIFYMNSQGNITVPDEKNGGKLRIH